MVESETNVVEVAPPTDATLEVEVVEAAIVVVVVEATCDINGSFWPKFNPVVVVDSGVVVCVVDGVTIRGAVDPAVDEPLPLRNTSAPTTITTATTEPRIMYCWRFLEGPGPPPLDNPDRLKSEDAFLAI